MGVYERLRAQGWELPAVKAARGPFLPGVLHNGILTVSGRTSSSGPFASMGKAGINVTLEQATLGARQALLHALTAAQQVIGDLNRVERVIRLTGYVNAGPDFTQQPEVINGASEALIALFADAGEHARTAVGVASLPSGATVEVDLYLAVRE
jgi:enamine deaminase RidA (YjgF/YER057c/UK114 family)